MHLEVGDQVTLVRESESDSLSRVIDAEKASSSLSNTFEEDLINIFSDEGIGTLKRKIISMYLAGYTAIYFKIESRTRYRSDGIQLILENIGRTAEYASDIAETAINETINEIIETNKVEDDQTYE